MRSSLSMIRVSLYMALRFRPHHIVVAVHKADIRPCRFAFKRVRGIHAEDHVAALLDSYSDILHIAIIVSARIPHERARWQKIIRDGVAAFKTGNLIGRYLLVLVDHKSPSS